MTTRKRLKQLVRIRAAKTGESYAAALRHVRAQPTEMTVSETPMPACSFCDKSQKEVAKLVAGPRGVYICGECVALCSEMVQVPDGDAEAPSAASPSPEDVKRLHLKVLATVADRVRLDEHDLVKAVERFRTAGGDWEAVAGALKITADEARARFDSTT